MQVLYPRCCALDVHKLTVVACLRIADDSKVTSEVRTFETTTASLIGLRDWLTANKCTHVAMEATGVYWKPVWHILSDGEFELVLANAAHVKNVPGRKTDVSDAEWVVDLLAHGLIRPSFVPNSQTQELRALMRTRKQLVREAASHIQRVQKTLEDANIKLDSVISDIMGMSGRAMIEAMIAGETNPTKLAAFADRRLKASPAQLREALRGRVTKQHRFLLRLHLEQIDALAAAIAEIDQQVDFPPFCKRFFRSSHRMPTPADYFLPRRRRHFARSRGHQWNSVLSLIVPRCSVRATQRSPTALSRSSIVSKHLLASGSSTNCQRCSAGCSSGL